MSPLGRIPAWYGRLNTDEAESRGRMNGFEASRLLGWRWRDKESLVTEGNAIMALQVAPISQEDEIEIGSDSEPGQASADGWLTPGGIAVTFRAQPLIPGHSTSVPRDLWLHQKLARLSLLRGFDELLCLEGLRGVEHLPHQIETVRKVLRHFRGRVLLADEVGLGKTIEACMLLREYLLRGMARRVLILVPAPLVSQWHEELSTKFDLEFVVPPRGTAADRAEFWTRHERVLASLAFVKAKKRAALLADQPWDLVIVDEAHHCKNRATLNWQLVNSLKRRFMFLLSATPVQNNLMELYNLLTLLSPGHLAPKPISRSSLSSAAIRAARSTANGCDHCWAR